MPLYEYDCRGCGHRFEALVRGAEVPACPECASQDLERVLTSFSVSSETTKRSNLAAGRAEHKKSQRDAKVAQAEYERHHREH